MSGTRRHQARLQLASTGEGVSGPSYFDVRELLVELEREFGVRTQFLIDPENVTERWKFKRMWVRLRIYKPGSHGHGDMWQGHALGGNSDAQTMPACMLAVVLTAWDDLERIRQQELIPGA